MKASRAFRQFIAPFSIVALLLSAVVEDELNDLVVVGVEDPVLVGAGDIASCDGTGDEATAKLLDGIPGTVFTAGDNAYDSGTAAEFANCYDPTWGRHKARTMPATGNHEYLSTNASPYFSYFGAAAGDPTRGYYSYDRGAWHIIVLNSNCDKVGGCETGSPQEQWLRADLAANPTTCTLAYWRHPRFSSGSPGNTTAMAPFWNALYEAGADVVLGGHAHVYERFAPQNPNGQPDPNGIRQFVVGMGGDSHSSFGTTKPNSQIRNSTTYGVLKLTLHPTSYDWQFVPEAGKTFTDVGSTACSATTTATTPTSAPVATSLSIAAGADAYVTKGELDTNFGASNLLKVDSSPTEESYLRFAVRGVSGTLQSAKLRLYSTNGSDDGPAIYTTGSDWSETGITWNNKPTPIGAPVGDEGTIPRNSWIEYDVTSKISGDGAYSFVLVPTSSDGADFNSREAASNKPQLVLTLASGAAMNTPTATNTSTATRTATNTPTINTPTGIPAPTSTPPNTPVGTPRREHITFIPMVPSY